MKNWVDDLQRHVAYWSARLAGRNLDWWPRSVYHFTDVCNAISILNSGVLYSRELVIKLGLMEVDNARPSVIESTPEFHLKYVRFYFRPVTPTQYRNEGIFLRRFQNDGHCPVPVFFLFDLVALVSRDDAHFSKGTMATRGTNPSSRREYFREIDFAKVYHNHAFPAAQRDAIVQARHAEVVIPNQLVLGEELRAVICRSAAERQTLLQGLDLQTYLRWANRIRVNNRTNLFVSRPHDGVQRHYIETVDGFDDTKIRVELFNPPWDDLDVRLFFRSEDGQEYDPVRSTFPAGSKSITYELRHKHGAGMLTYLIEGCLAYKGHVILDDRPF